MSLSGSSSSRRLVNASSTDSMTPPTTASSHHTHGAEQSSLLQSARLKLSTMDQEAMKKMRSTMMDYPESTSSKSSPSSARFPPAEYQDLNSNGTGSGSGARKLRTRRSTLSKQIPLGETQEEGEEKGQMDSDDTPKPNLGGSSTPPSANADYAIAVLGHEHVGKTTVIARALRTWGMSHPLKTHSAGGHTIISCYSQIQPGGKLKQPWKVEFLEMNMHAINLSPTASPSQIWPEGVPDVAGVIFCYDAGRSDTLSGIGEALERLSPSGIPIVILACKSDPDIQLEVDAHHGNSIGEPFNVGLIEVTTQTSEGKSKMRNALRWLIYKLEQRQRRQQRKLNGTTLTLSQQQHPPPSPALASATLEALSSPIDSDASSSENKIMWHHRGGFNMTPADRDQEGDGMSDHRSSGSSLNWVMKGPGPGVPARSSLEVDPANSKEQQKHTAIGQNIRDSDGQGIPAENDTGERKEGKVQERVVTQSGVQLDAPIWLTAEELLNRLFAAIVSSQDEPFVRAFAMTFRRFMEPREVMQEFLVRLKEVEGYDVSRDVKNWTMMKMTGALVDWTTRYPGDLQDSSTQSIFKDILAFILHHTFMAHLTGELIMVEHSLSEVMDLDQSWSLRNTNTHAKSSASILSNNFKTELVIDTEVLYEYPNSSLEKGIILEDEPPDTPFSKDTHDVPNHSTRSVSTSSLPMENGKSHSSSDNHTNDNGKEKMGPHSHVSDETGMGMGFHKWAQAFNVVLNMDARSFAVELTKLQWNLFAAIRPRDVLRHDLGKETDGPVGKAILFFNHISRWVSTLILTHPKPKHRARIIERFIMIAHQLRRLNNYDTLYAVISGMRETSVHRLSLTQSLVGVSPTLEKDYQSHLKLMDPRGGYVHYRRALQADISNGRASIPLLTNILGLVNRLQNVRKEDKRTVEVIDQDGIKRNRVEIQWDKFYKIGEILHIITECQIRGPIVRGDVQEGFRRVVEDTAIISNEDGLWERSQLLEPSGGGTVGGKVLKRLVNLGFS